jgi:hypothetical protein
MCCKELAKTAYFESSSTRLAGIQRRDFEPVGKSMKDLEQVTNLLTLKKKLLLLSLEP